jgi:prolyl-tRNA synthetase
LLTRHWGWKNLTCGANRDDYHLSGVTPDRDYSAEYFDLRLIRAGEPCVQCGKPLLVSKALEVGHIFKLGTKYSESLGAHVLTAEGKPVPIVMGSYGIGLERILAAAIEGRMTPMVFVATVDRAISLRDLGSEYEGRGVGRLPNGSMKICRLAD